MAAQSSVIREYIYGRSWSSWFFWWILKLFLPILKRKDVIAPRGPQILDFPPPNLGACTADRWAYKDWTMVELIPPPREKGRRASRIMMYMYGSGFTRPIHPRQWGFAAYMAEKLDAETSVIPYPLPPLNDAKNAIPALLNVYRAFLERAQGHEVILLADSGGSHVALCLLYAVVSQSPQLLPLPHQLILISPNLNTEMNNPALYKLAPYDPALNPAHSIHVNRLWAGGDPSVPVAEEDARNPMINPMAGNIALLKQALIPPVPARTTPVKLPVNGNGSVHLDNERSTGMQVVVVSGGYDILHGDILVWVDRAEKAGLNVHYIEGVRQVHDFPTGRKLIWEGRVVTDRVVEVVKKRSVELGFGIPQFVDNEGAIDV